MEIDEQSVNILFLGYILKHPEACATAAWLSLWNELLRYGHQLAMPYRCTKR